MEKVKFKELFEPIRIGKTLFRNRIFAAPTGYRVLPPGGFLNEEAFAYYERKAIGGAASVAVGQSDVDSKMGKSALHHISVDDPFASDSLHRTAQAISRHGAVATIELNHAGMFANRFLTGEGAWAYGPMDGEIDGKPVIAMTEEVIEDFIGLFAKAALFAKQCGFGMILVHAGHGWGLSQFISPQMNRRKDKWGGCVENRVRLTVAVADAIHKVCGGSFPVEMRISGSECYSGGYDIDEGIAIAKQLDGHVDIIHVSAGSHEVDEVFTVTHPSMFLDDGCNVKYAAEIKKHVKTPVATVGALSDPALLNEIVASGKADIVEIARGLLAEPDLPNKARAGRVDEIKKCMRCMQCYSKHTIDGSFHCAITPATGRELDYKPYILPRTKKNVLVAGGGIGGMQAAITCAERGHNVLLFEKNTSLGGKMLCEDKVPFKKKLGEYLEHQIRSIKNSGIETHLNTEATPAVVELFSPDVVIASLGASAVIPQIRGIKGNNVISAEEAYRDPGKVGKRAAIIGGGLVGSELAIFLSLYDREVTIIEMMDKLNDSGNHLHMKGIVVEIKRYGIKVYLNTRVLEIDDKRLLCERNDEKLSVTADTIIYAVGYEPLADEALTLRFSAPEFFMIGDCVTPKNIMNATTEAFTIACDIGRY